MKRGLTKIELLAPARNVVVGIAAIDCGADAVYIGASRFGARAQAGNSTADIGRLCDHAHRYDARVYATVNTILFDHELKEAELLVKELYAAGVDALIVQDMALLRLDIPPIALHASTQCDIRTPEKARFLASLGFSQLVLARELSLDEIRAVSREVDVPLEAFVHGALCVSYSGRCQASHAFCGRSANRGECAQLCRLPYDLVDGDGHVLMSGKHLLSLRDFNATSVLAAMIDAGVSSFKIEGRLKDEYYVKNIVAHYRRCLDEIIATHSELARASTGRSVPGFEPAPYKSFNRSFTTYFVDGHRTPREDDMACLDTPKSMGEPVGYVTAVKGRDITLSTRLALANGDGFSFMGPDGTFAGFRANKVNGSTVTTLEKVKIASGTMVYRTRDKAFNDVLTSAVARRTMGIDCELRLAGDSLVLAVSDERGCRVEHSVKAQGVGEARTPQGAKQREVLAKLGDTVYTLREAVVLDTVFVPASLLTRLRRETLALLERTHAAIRKVDLRRSEDRDARYPSTSLSAADNVANKLARQVYAEHGVTSITPALECQSGPVAEGTTVMRTRYCLRRQLGACLQKDGVRRLPATLWLRSGNVKLRVVCDCARCEMRLLTAR